MRISDWSSDVCSSDLKLIATAEDLEREKIGLVSLTESIDTTTPGGMLTFHVFGAIAQFERALIRERTTAGLVEARRKGRKGGRPSAMRPSDVAAARAMMKEGTLPVRDSDKSMGVRSEEHTSELQSLMRISYAVFCLKKKKKQNI